MPITSRIDACLVVFAVMFFGACADEVEPIDYLARCADGFIDGTCPTGCDPVVSVNTWSPLRTCAKDGVVLSCMPNMWSEHWSTHVRSEIAIYCDRLASDPQYYVCYQGTPSIVWVLGNLELFCLNADCPEQTLVCDTEG